MEQPIVMPKDRSRDHFKIDDQVAQFIHIEDTAEFWPGRVVEVHYPSVTFLTRLGRMTVLLCTEPEFLKAEEFSTLLENPYLWLRWIGGKDKLQYPVHREFIAALIHQLELKYTYYWG